jgi:HEAT repeat protein
MEENLIKKETLFKTLNSRSQWKRIEALEQIALIDSSLAITVARASLSDPSSAVRRAAADVIGECGSKLDAYRLLLATYDASWQVRSSVVDALGSLRINQSANRIKQILHDDRHFIVRRDAAWSIACVDAEAALTLHEALLTENNKIVKCALYEVLYSLGDKAMLPNILQFFGEQNDLLRANVVNGLRLVNLLPADRDLVLNALGDLVAVEPNSGVAGDAVDLIESIKQVRLNDN